MTGVLFCFGLGYSAGVLARRLAADGWQVRGTTRSPAKAETFRSEGFTVDLFDRDRPLGDARRSLAGVTHVLTSIAPDEQGDPVLEAHEADLAACPTLRWVGYLGTTAVYGDRQGGWVDETSELRPAQPRAIRRAATERAWQASGLPVHLFRLAGIYGPGRSALDDLRAGTARRIAKPGQVFSRIHVEDIATVVAASMARPNPGAAYNVCDDEPASGADVTGYAAELMGIEPPPVVPYEEAELSPMARSFYADNRRVRNDRIKRELGVTLVHPSYREGLRSLADLGP